MSKSYLNDEYLYDLAGKSVVGWGNTKKNCKVGFLCGTIEAGQDAYDLLPKDMPKSMFTDKAVSDNSRFLVQTVAAKNNKLSARFYARSQADFILDANDTGYLINMCRAILRDWNVSVPIVEDRTGDVGNMSFDPQEKAILIHPTTLHKHVSRSFCITGWSIDMTLKFTLAHEVGHYEDEFMVLEQAKFKALIDEVNSLLGNFRRGSITPDQKRQLSLKYKDYTTMALNYELNAWNIGMKFIPQEHLPLYDFDNKRNIVAYAEGFDQTQSQIDNFFPLSSMFL